MYIYKEAIMIDSELKPEIVTKEELNNIITDNNLTEKVQVLPDSSFVLINNRLYLCTDIQEDYMKTKWQTKSIPVAELQENTDNPRIITDKDYEKL